MSTTMNKTREPLLSEQQMRDFIESWNGSIDDWKRCVERKMGEYVRNLYEADRTALLEQIDQLVEALTFYADPRKYLGPNQDPDPDEESAGEGSYHLDVTRDGGSKARALLAKYKAPTPTEK